MPEDHSKWFNTPVLQYITMKKEFQENFLKLEGWSDFGSRQQVIALSILLEYLRNTRRFADKFPEIVCDVVEDNKNMIIKRSLPIPQKLHEQLLLDVVQGAKQEYQQCHTQQD